MATLDRPYELKLASGRIVCWDGTSGVDAARRYVDSHRDAVVIAWRSPRRPEVLAVNPRRIRIFDT